MTEVELLGITERGYKRIRHFATRVTETGHTRYIDGSGVHAEDDFMGRSAKDKAVLVLYDRIMKGGRCSFPETAKDLWQWSAMHGGSILYAGNVPKALIGDYRFHPRSSALLANQRAAERLAAFDECTDFFREKGETRRGQLAAQLA